MIYKFVNQFKILLNWTLKCLCKKWTLVKCTLVGEVWILKNGARWPKGEQLRIKIKNKFQLLSNVLERICGIVKLKESPIKA